MPLLFKTQIKESAINGNGVFALENIPQGAIYWVYQCPKEKEVPPKNCESGPNFIYSKEQMQKVKDPNKLAAIFHGGFYYEERDLFIQLRDGTHYMNHSEDCNSQIVYNPERDYKKLYSIASKDIKAGDQITEFYGNYFSSKGKWVQQLMEKYFPQRKNFENSIAVSKIFGVNNV